MEYYRVSYIRRNGSRLPSIWTKGETVMGLEGIVTIIFVTDITITAVNCFWYSTDDRE